MLYRKPLDWGGVRATLIRRERVVGIEQRFHLPFHVFRLGVSGTFGAGSTTALGTGAPAPLVSGPRAVSFYPSGTTILNAVTRASRLTYLTVEIEADLAGRLLAEGFDPGRLEPVSSVGDEMVAALLQSLAPVREGFPPPQRLYCEQAALMLILAMELRSPASSFRPIARHRGGMSAPLLQRVTDFLLDRMSDDVSLEDLAALTNLSPTHLCRAFKQSTGKTPHRWRQTARIDNAKTLLATSKLSIAEISLIIGFAGQPQFTTAFHRETGWTPNKWRANRAL